MEIFNNYESIMKNCKNKIIEEKLANKKIVLFDFKKNGREFKIRMRIVTPQYFLTISWWKNCYEKKNIYEISMENKTLTFVISLSNFPHLDKFSSQYYIHKYFLLLFVKKYLVCQLIITLKTLRNRFLIIIVYIYISCFK